MPAKSSKQYGLMAGVMSGGIPHTGIPKKVAKHFVEETPAKKRSTFAKHLRKGKKDKK